MCDNYCDCHRRCSKCGKLKTPTYPGYPTNPYNPWPIYTNPTWYGGSYSQGVVQVSSTFNDSTNLGGVSHNAQ